MPDFAATIPFSRGAAEVLAWYNADASRRTINEEFNATCDRMIASYETIWPATPAR